MPTPADTPLLLDVMLGKLATYLRMCGYDTAYALDRGVEEDALLHSIAEREGRTLLTRDVELAAAVPAGVLLESRDFREQLLELSREGFVLSLDAPSRCSCCNGRLDHLDPGVTTPSFAPDPEERAVWRCRDCGRPFWRGSHWDDVSATLEDVRRAAEEGRSSAFGGSEP
jgi:uncharacterized protein